MIEVLREIEHRARASVNTANLIDMTMALSSIVGMARQAISSLERVEGLAVQVAAPAAQSSVQIEQAAKGPPRVTVKTYGATTAEAAAEAVRVYGDTVAWFAPEATVSEGSPQ